jgi:predicted RNase H-like nuclease (RuvC/YqgF family)
MEREQAEATLRHQITGLENVLEEKDRQSGQVEMTLHGQITGLEKGLEEKEMEKVQAEATLHRQIICLEKRLEEKDRESGQVETTLRGQIEEQMETLCGWMTEFKKMDEKDGEGTSRSHPPQANRGEWKKERATAKKWKPTSMDKLRNWTESLKKK